MDHLVELNDEQAVMVAIMVAVGTEPNVAERVVRAEPFVSTVIGSEVIPPLTDLIQQLGSVASAYQQIATAWTSSTTDEDR